MTHLNLLAAHQSQLINLLAGGANASDIACLEAQGAASMPAHDAMHFGQSVQAAFSIQKHQSVQTQREKGLLAALETAQDITAIRDLESVLHAIVRRARQTFSTDIGYLTHFDSLRQDFYIRAIDGATSELLKKVRVPPDYGVCSHVLKHKSAYHCSNYIQDQGFCHDADIDLAIRDEGVCSLLGAPLMVGSTCIGILCVCDRQPRSFEPWEVSMLSMLAAQAAIAIENARLFQEAKLALQQVSEANAQLHEKTVEIESAAEAHDQLIKLIAGGGNSIDLVAMLSQLLHHDVALLDDAEQLVHCTTASTATVTSAPNSRLAQLLTQTSVQDAIHAALSDSRRQGRSQSVHLSDGVVLHVTAITGTNRLLGGLVLLGGLPLLSNTRIRMFERGALAAGVVLLSAERAKHFLASQGAATIRALLNGRDERPLTELHPNASGFGLDLHAPLHMALVDVDNAKLEYALNRLRLYLPAGVLMEQYDGVIVTLCNAPSAQDNLNAIQRYLLSDPRLDAVAVFNSAGQELRKLGQNYLSLRRCVQVLRILGRSRELVNEQAISMYALLFEHRKSSEIDVFIRAHIGHLIDHDRSKSAALCDTLLTHLNHAQNFKLTAGQLGIHVNTLRQRLELVDYLLGDWRANGQLLEVHMALRLQRVATAIQ